jgi:hypothetical protein
MSYLLFNALCQNSPGMNCVMSAQVVAVGFKHLFYLTV